MDSRSQIKVNGRASLCITPNTTRIDLSLEKVLPTNEEASQMAAANLKKLGDVVESCGLDRDLPKTTHFSISKSYHFVKEDGTYNGDKEFDGYKLALNLQIELGVDNELSTRVVQGIARNLKDMEIKISFSVKDPQSYQLKLLENAVKDATEKARVMATAAGCTLGQVASIEYQGYGRSLRITQEEYSVEYEEYESADFSDLTPKAIEEHEDVTIQWYLV